VDEDDLKTLQGSKRGRLQGCKTAELDDLKDLQDSLSRLQNTFFEEDSRAAKAELDDLTPLKQEGNQREDSRAANAELDDPKALKEDKTNGKTPGLRKRNWMTQVFAAVHFSWERVTSRVTLSPSCRDAGSTFTL
jgi:hypothetical protein